MSRRSHVVRTFDHAQGAARPRDEQFTWNAMLTSYGETDFLPDDQSYLLSEWVRHTSLGVDVDFDVSDYPVVKIRIPRDGIYSMSARAYAHGHNDEDELHVEEAVFFNLHTSQPEDFVDIDRRPLIEANSGWGGPEAQLSVSHAGYPCEAGDRIWVGVWNKTQGDITVSLRHLSVTYEAQLGTVFTKGDT